MANILTNTQNYNYKRKNDKFDYVIKSKNFCSSKDTILIPKRHLKEYMYSYVHCSVIHNSQDLETAQVPINTEVDKKAVVHLHDGYYIGNLTFSNSMMNLENIMLSEMSQ